MEKIFKIPMSINGYNQMLKLYYQLSSVDPRRREMSGDGGSEREHSIWRTGPVATSLPEKRSFSWPGCGFESPLGKRSVFDCEVDVLSPLSMVSSHTPQEALCMEAHLIFPSSCGPQNVLEELACFIHFVTTLLGEETYSVPQKLTSYPWRP